MKLIDLYYCFKPAIPHQLRLKMRSRLAAIQRRRTAGTWPINEGAARQPERWPGWPGGKSFAFVLTHDVEGRKGLRRCRALAELEMKLGFRSSFNFVPEGEYDTDDSLRRFLEANGFEVGVHDLRHNGTLYRSKREFSAAAKRINQHLKNWQAVGFRSAFMLHNLEWLKELDILYDASTFDTDPFEPQPDGANTIYPFWVERADASGYVELPYTLPQDSTLFLLLREKTNQIWKSKIEWVARNGGMALVNVHPDYVSFNGAAGSTEFPSSLYEDFLAFVTANFGDDVFHALPRDVAYFAAEHIRPKSQPFVAQDNLHGIYPGSTHRPAMG